MLAASSSMPNAVLYPLAVAFVAIHGLVLHRTPGLAGKFLITAIWLRYLLGAFHEVTFSPLVAGWSINALVSLAVFGIGALLLGWRHLLLKPLLPVYALLCVILLSALANGVFAPAVGAFVKWGYFLVILLAFIQAAEEMGPRRLLPLVLTALAPPLVLQLLSLALGVGKASDRFGAVAYIGGYFHESAFSTILLTGLFLAVISPGLRPALRIGLVSLSIAGLIMANYRTTLLAAAPLATVFLVMFPLQLVRRHDRPFVLVSAIWPALLAAWLAVWIFQDRFVELVAAFDTQGTLIQDPDSFTLDERRLLSARAYIWSSYLYGYLEGSDIHLLLGFGPDAWTEVFSVYAHNTLISYLYEFGALGTMALLVLWIAMAAPARHCRDRSLGLEIFAAHAAFLILNMATMPLWLIEGLILYALICGSTLYLAGSRVQPAAGAPAQYSARPTAAG